MMNRDAPALRSPASVSNPPFTRESGYLAQRPCVVYDPIARLAVIDATATGSHSSTGDEPRSPGDLARC